MRTIMVPVEPSTIPPSASQCVSFLSLRSVANNIALSSNRRCCGWMLNTSTSAYAAVTVDNIHWTLLVLPCLHKRVLLFSWQRAVVAVLGRFKSDQEEASRAQQEGRVGEKRARREAGEVWDPRGPSSQQLEGREGGGVEHLAGAVKGGKEMHVSKVVRKEASRKDSTKVGNDQVENEQCEGEGKGKEEDAVDEEDVMEVSGGTEESKGDGCALHCVCRPDSVGSETRCPDSGLERPTAQAAAPSIMCYQRREGGDSPSAGSGSGRGTESTTRAAAATNSARQIAPPASVKNDVSRVGERSSASPAAAEIASEGAVPATGAAAAGEGSPWWDILAPVRQLSTNNAAPMRICIRRALRAAPPPPRWAAEQLQESISEKVYKHNGAGPTKVSREYRSV